MLTTSEKQASAGAGLILSGTATTVTLAVSGQTVEHLPVTIAALMLISSGVTLLLTGVFSK